MPVSCSGAGPTLTQVGPEEAKRLADAPGTLALIRFGGARCGNDGASPWIGTGLRPLGEAPAPVHCWRAEGAAGGGRRGRFGVRLAPGLALAAAVVADAADPAPLAADLYRELFALARELGRPHLLRVWQYLPRITQPCAGENRYQRFCAGRRQAFAEAGRPEGALPAACLLGDDGDSLLLYALLADEPGVQVENPRQVSAFRYPPEYGRAAPSFSRALAKRWPGGARQLYISGTASVVGHASAHADTPTQLEETLANLGALLAAGGFGPAGTAPAAVAPLTVYLRNAGDLPAVRRLLAARLPPEHPVTYLRADVCRRELLVEIEGMASAASTPAARPLE